MPATYTVEIDWDRDGWGGFPDPLNDITEYVRSVRFFVGFREPYKNIAGEMSLEVRLDNSSQRFSPEYTSSPLYGKFWRDTPIRVTMDINPGFTTLWTGIIDTVLPEPGINGSKRANIRATGYKRIFDKATLNLPIQVGLSTGEILENIIESVNLPTVSGGWAVEIPGYSEVEVSTRVAQGYVTAFVAPGGQTPAYAGDNWNGISAYEAIKQVIEAERGKFYFDRFGFANFIDRDQLITEVDDFETLDDTQIIGFDYVYGADVVNKVTVTYYPRQIDTSDTLLWSLDAPIDIPAGTEKRIRAKYNDQTSDTRVAALTTVRPSTDAGTLVFSTGSADLVTWQPDATGAEMIFVARDTDATISEIEIWGTKITRFNKSEAVARDDAAAYYDGATELFFDLPILDNGNLAQAIADYEVGRRSRAKGAFRSVTLMNKTDALTTSIAENTISMRVRLSEQQTAHEASYFIIGEEHDISEAFTKHVVTWFLEPASSSTFWTVETVDYSELEETTRVAP